MLEHSAKITENFCYAIRSHSRATANQNLHCSKERRQDTKKDKGKSHDARTVDTADGEKALFGLKRRQIKFLYLYRRIWGISFNACKQLEKRISGISNIHTFVQFNVE